MGGGHGGEDTDAADTDGADTDVPLDASQHNHTLVVQEVRPDGDAWSTETKPLLTAHAKLGQTLRGNVIGFGDQFHTFHTHGYTWRDPATGMPMDTRTVGPAESFAFTLPDLDNPGLWMVHCHVDSHLHMMMSYLLVD
jgi:FtsP/CotA-like multicopper oxidase with cupredoxin domain